MKLTPLDIRKQEFRRSMRGFDAIEVEAFLQMVAEEYEIIIRERNQLADELLKLRTQLKDYQDVEKTLRETLLSAQQNVSESRENSRREADLILRDAELRAEAILEESREELNRLKNDIRLARTQKISFTSRLRHLLESQLELLSVLDIDDVDTEFHQIRPAHPKSRQRASIQMEEELDLGVLDDVRDEYAQITASEPRIVRNVKTKAEYNLDRDDTINSARPGVKDTKTTDKDNSRLSDQIII